LENGNELFRRRQWQGHGECFMLHYDDFMRYTKPLEEKRGEIKLASLAEKQQAAAAINNLHACHSHFNFQFFYDLEMILK